MNCSGAGDHLWVGGAEGGAHVRTYARAVRLPLCKKRRIALRLERWDQRWPM
jgi:hypothetical protein